MEGVGSFFRKDIKPFLISEIIGVLVCALFSVLLSLVFSKVPGVSSRLLSVFAVAVLALGAFSSGFVTAGFKKQNGLTTGTFAGFILFFMVSFIGRVIFGSRFTVFSLLKLAVSVVFGGIGGVLAVNKK